MIRSVLLSALLVGLLFQEPPPAVQPQPPALISGAVIAGLLVKSVPAVYPRLAKIGHQSGSVVVRILISKDGVVEKAEVMKSSNAMFNESALDAARQWRFKGYVLNGVPVEVDSTLVMNFNTGS